MGKHQLGPSGGRGGPQPHRAPSEGHRQAARCGWPGPSPCTRREHEVEHRPRWRGALGQDHWGDVHRRARRREHLAVVALEPLPAVEVDHPAAGGPGEEAHGENTHGEMSPTMRPRSSHQDDPRHQVARVSPVSRRRPQAGRSSHPTGRPVGVSRSHRVTHALEQVEHAQMQGRRGSRRRRPPRSRPATRAEEPSHEASLCGRAGSMAAAS